MGQKAPTPRQQGKKVKSPYVSINSKPDHPPRQNSWAIFLMGEFPTPGQKEFKPPSPGPIKRAKTPPPGQFPQSFTIKT